MKQETIKKKRLWLKLSGRWDVSVNQCKDHCSGRVEGKKYTRYSGERMAVAYKCIYCGCRFVKYCLPSRIPKYCYWG